MIGHKPTHLEGVWQGGDLYCAAPRLQAPFSNFSVKKEKINDRAQTDHVEGAWQGGNVVAADDSDVVVALHPPATVAYPRKEMLSMLLFASCCSLLTVAPAFVSSFIVLRSGKHTSIHHFPLFLRNCISDVCFPPTDATVCAYCSIT
jgi:hypothetical protein